jgi:RND family efflux transporter MFP subunit
LHGQRAPEQEGALTMQIQAGGEERPTQEVGQAERRTGEPKPVTVAHPTWHYPKPFEDYLGRLGAHQVVEVRSRLGGVLGKIHFKVGEVVKKGDLLFEIDPDMYKAQVEKAVQELKAKEAEARRQAAALERYQEWVAQGSVARSALDQIASKAEAANAALRAARATFEVARRNLEGTKILAPVAGRVVERIVSPQDRIEANSTALAKIAPAGRIGVHFEMDERSLLRYRRLLAAGQVQESGGPLYVGLADEDGFPHEATLSRFNSQVDASKGTIGVYGTLPNSGGILLPGMSARVRIPFTKQRRALAVPDAAVVTDGGKQFVWVVGKGDVAERRAVKAGAKEGRLRLIESGLRPDEQIITGGTDGLRPGDRVEPRRPGAKE